MSELRGLTEREQRALGGGDTQGPRHGPRPMMVYGATRGGMILRLWGGPWSSGARTDADYRVCLSEPRDGDRYDDHLHWPDFGVPDNDEVVTESLRDTLRALVARGERVYVGCGWGQGRTGTYIALLLKALGHGDPVTAARCLYNVRAVETPAQERYVEGFDAGPVRRGLWWWTVRGWLRGLRRSLADGAG